TAHIPCTGLFVATEKVHLLLVCVGFSLPLFYLSHSLSFVCYRSLLPVYCTLSFLLNLLSVPVTPFLVPFASLALSPFISSTFQPSPFSVFILFR
ncbi:hypothetical protein NDU88_002683, partial [Pleurodeles waltl]